MFIKQNILSRMYFENNFQLIFTKKSMCCQLIKYDKGQVILLYEYKICQLHKQPNQEIFLGRIQVK
jgi:hypothetical protein